MHLCDYAEPKNTKLTVILDENLLCSADDDLRRNIENFKLTKFRTLELSSSGHNGIFYVHIGG